MRGFVNIYFDSSTKSKPTTIIGRISGVEHVQFAHLVTGDVAAMAFVDTPDSEAFLKTILAINAISGVDHTSTNVVL